MKKVPRTERNNTEQTDFTIFFEQKEQAEKTELLKQAVKAVVNLQYKSPLASNEKSLLEARKVEIRNLLHENTPVELTECARKAELLLTLLIESNFAPYSRLVIRDSLQKAIAKFDELNTIENSFELIDKASVPPLPFRKPQEVKFPQDILDKKKECIIL